MLTLFAGRGAKMQFQSIEEAASHNVDVNHWRRGTITAEQCILCLANAQEALTAKIMDLYAIAPRRFLLPDGRMMVWRCPDGLIPLTDISGCSSLEDRNA